MLDCGLTPKQMAAKGIRLASLSACLVTHSHKDHCKGLSAVTKAAVDTFMLKECHTAIGEKSHRISFISPREAFRVGTMAILPFELEHDVPTLGFLIESDGGSRAVYITDTAFCSYNFKDLEIIAIECNYNSIGRNIPADVARRVYGSHMALEQTLGFVKANMSDKLKEVRLLHLSDSNSNEKLMREAVQARVGEKVKVTVAEK